MTLEDTDLGQVGILEDIKETEDVIDLVLEEGYEQEDLDAVKEKGLASSNPGSQEIYLTEEGESVLENRTNSTRYGELNVDDLSFDDISFAEKEVLEGLLEDPDSVAENARVSSGTVDKYKQRLVGMGYLEEDGEGYLPGEKVLEKIDNGQEEVDAESHEPSEFEDVSTETSEPEGIDNGDLGASTGWAPFIVTFKAWDAYKNAFLGEVNGYVEEPEDELVSTSTGGRDPMEILNRGERGDLGEIFDAEELSVEEIGPELGDANYREGLIHETKKMLKENGGQMEKTEFYDELGWGYDKADRVLREAAKEGKVRVFGHGNRGGIVLTNEHYETRIREYSNM